MWVKGNEMKYARSGRKESSRANCVDILIITIMFVMKAAFFFFYNDTSIN